MQNNPTRWKGTGDSHDAYGTIIQLQSKQMTYGIYVQQRYINT